LRHRADLPPGSDSRAEDAFIAAAFWRAESSIVTVASVRILPPAWKVESSELVVRK
jgi:hypothetical protein